ncbi:MAG: LysM peptidoglycan-binding domain-containing protein [Nitrososphaerota archaeon]|nr:LysM peptidoglycan-binding domain-containing protein [Nitrososphaerota archaeon]
MISPSGWFNLNTDGTLQTPANRAQFVTKMHEMGIRVVVCLNNHWDQATGINALNNADRLTTQLAYYVELYDLDGINVDIENATLAQRDLYIKFMAMLREKIPEHKEVSIAVSANPSGTNSGWAGSYDYASINPYVDYFMIMTYDEHYEGGSAGSVSSINFVEKSIQYALTKTAADKIVVGIPFYGRLWSVGNTNFRGIDVTNSNIDLLIKTYNGLATFDAVTQSAKIEFNIKKGDTLLTIQGRRLAVGNYVILYENTQSIQAKMELVQKYNIKGVGAWALGQENTTIWNNYTNWLNGPNNSKPTTPIDQTNDYSVIYDTNGGTNTPTKTQQKQGTTITITNTIPTKTGYTFTGWLYNGKTYTTGQTLTMPAKSITLTAQWTQNPTTPTITYTIKSGDTLWAIAQRYGTSVNAIKTLNGLTSDLIYPNQQLQIPR